MGATVYSSNYLEYDDSLSSFLFIEKSARIMVYDKV